MKHKKLLIAVSTASLFAFFGSLAAQEESDVPDVDNFREEVRRNMESGDLSEALRSNIQEFRENQARLREELAARIKDLEDPTSEEIRDITRQFREEHAEAVQAQRESAREIREELARLRMEHRPDRERPEPPEAVRELHQRLKEARKTLQEKRRARVQQIANADSEEARKEMIEQFRQEQRDEVQQLIELRRDLREEVRGNRGGDRRVGEGG